MRVSLGLRVWEALQAAAVTPRASTAERRIVLVPAILKFCETNNNSMSPLSNIGLLLERQKR
ncbi:hypothetical protein MesoLjLc_56220 [Mesorhizobium sp. L-8-10]|nr:hypothetical protein MesoLjLc_56220 [Mesorhizobium sp. L-8-10]